MKNDFICPICKGHLVVGGNVVFTIQNKKNKGLLMLSPELGNYSYMLHDSLEGGKDEEYKYFCPICHAELTAKNVNENLVHVHMLDEDNNIHEIYFSSMISEECTYRVVDEEFEKYGSHAPVYFKYFATRHI